MYGILVLVLCSHALTQPVSDEPSNRRARELIECCPCPGARDGQDWLADDGQLARGVDDCPCRARGADSEGASSLFFPAALRPDGSHLRPNDPKEDPKNLLEPEVALAASVLGTLREATEEEYRDALEREAARNAAEPDTVPEESGRDVVFVLNPGDSDNDDDFISEASHVQESRCIHPLESSSLERMRNSAKPLNILPESFKLHKLKRPELPYRNLLHFDNNLGASNVEESIVNTNRNVPKFVSETPGFKHTAPVKTLLDSQNTPFRFSKPNFKLEKFDDKESIEGLKLSLVPKFSRTNIIDDDLSSAPSNVQQNLESTTDKTSQLFRNEKLPFNLRNLLKLRDVELIPKTIRNKSWAKPKFDVSKFAIPSLFKSNQNKNCDRETKYSNIVSSENRDSEQREIEVVNDSITDTTTIKDTGVFHNTKDNSLHELNKLFNKKEVDSISHENISDDDESDATESKQINVDALSSPSQVQPSIIITNDEMGSDPIVSQKSVADCNFLDLNDFGKNTELSEILEDSHKTDSDSPDIANIAREDGGNLNDDSEVSKDTHTDQDSKTDTSNVVLSSLMPLEMHEKTITDPRDSQENLEKQSVDKYEVGSEMIPERFVKTPEVPHAKLNLSETLSNLRKTMVKQLKNLKKPSLKSGLFKTLENDNMNVDNEEERIIDGDFNHVAANLPANTDNIESKPNVADISMNDLQNMSDKLLDSNLNVQSSKNYLDSPESNIPDNRDFELSDINDKNDSELSETKLNSIAIEKEINETDENDDSSTSKNVEQNACLTNLETVSDNMGEKITAKSATQDTEPKEMDTGASENVVNTLPGVLDSLNSNLKLSSPLLSNLVLQPSSDPLNLLGKPLGDVLNINTNLPTLDELRERLVNIFNIDDGSIDNDSSSLEADYADDSPSSLEADYTNGSPLETMATEASTRNSQKQLPLIKQLEDFNSDIFKKKPKILAPFDTLTKSRMLDLNSYRAHLPSPNSLELKPLNIGPRLRNKAEKNKPASNFGSFKSVPSKLMPSSTLVNPLDSFPTLEELRNTLRSNTKNLLNNPVHSDLNLLSENLRPHGIEDVAKNIQLNTEKTFKGIQRKMKSSLRNPKLHNPLGDSLAKPQELLEDMNDRLKGIQYDLNDRLSSIRESMLDSSRLKTLVDEPRKAANRNVMTNLWKPKTKPTRPRLQTAASTTRNLEINPQPLGLEPRNYISPGWDKLRNTQTAAESASSPARIEIPKSVNSPLSYLHRTPFKQNPIVTELRERKPTPSLNRGVTPFKDARDSFSRTAMNPFDGRRQQNKVTISFGTTTLPPILPSRPTIKIPNISSSQFNEFNPSTSSGAIDTFSKENAAVNFGPSGKLKPLRTSAPLHSPIDEDFEDTLSKFSNDEIPSTDTRIKPSVFRKMSKPDTLKVHSNSNRLKSANIFDELENHASKSAVKATDWPRASENSFFSKVNAANLKNIANLPKSIKDARSEQLDMLRSPSEDTSVVIDEPLKENVSYRCRMVCTKEIK